VRGVNLMLDLMIRMGAEGIRRDQLRTSSCATVCDRANAQRPNRNKGRCGEKAKWIANRKRAGLGCVCSNWFTQCVKGNPLSATRIFCSLLTVTSVLFPNE
jgi:hypothetical protein